MRHTLFALWWGTAVALWTPLWLRGHRLSGLLRDEPARRPQRPEPVLSLCASLYLLRLLSRLPFSPWRNTCLYRSVAECLLLRQHGIEARLVIGVRREGDNPGSVVAHAWVVRSGIRQVQEDAQASTAYQPLQHARIG